MSGLSGHCLCGQVTYTVSADPLMMVNCHCTHCQRQSGAAFSTNVVVPRDALEVKGETLSEYVTTAEDEGKPTRRLFCSNCGSPVASLAEYLPEIAFVKSGTLDDTSVVKPGMDAWTSSAMSWVDFAHADRQQLERGRP
jgi:hypothetical protein